MGKFQDKQIMKFKHHLYINVIIAICISMLLYLFIFGGGGGWEGERTFALMFIILIYFDIFVLEKGVGKRSVLPIHYNFVFCLKMWLPNIYIYIFVIRHISFKDLIMSYRNKCFNELKS